MQFVMCLSRSGVMSPKAAPKAGAKAKSKAKAKEAGVCVCVCVCVLPLNMFAAPFLGVTKVARK